MQRLLMSAKIYKCWQRDVYKFCIQVIMPKLVLGLQIRNINFNKRFSNMPEILVMQTFDYNFKNGIETRVMQHFLHQDLFTIKKH